MNAVKFSVSPDIKYVLLLSDIVHDDDDSPDDGGAASHGDEQQPQRTMARYHVFEVQARNQFPLSHKDSGVQLAPHLQHVLWAPNSQSIIDRQVQRAQPLKSAAAAAAVGQSGNVNSNNNGGIASTTALVAGQPVNVSTRESISIGGSVAEGVNSNAGKPWGPSSSTSTAGAIEPLKLITGTAGGGKAVNNHQAIAFVHENDIYYKPKVQQDLVCRITITGEFLGEFNKSFSLVV